MAIPINILKGTRSILKWFESVNISMTDGFCHSVDLNINSLDLWDEFDPNINKGDLTIKVLIGSKTYEFMCEEREAPIEIEGTTFSVWGRSKQAWLDAPYARTVKDTADTTHPWQSGDVKVSEIISHIITNYCYAGLSVTWNVEDFMVYEGTFSVDEQSPIAIISSLADIVGAKINAHPDGTLTIDAYSVEEETPVESYNDLDHIVSFNESNQYSQGYNAITVSGKGTSTSPQLQYEVIEIDEDDKWQLGIARTVRVYYYHPEGLAPISYSLSGMTASFSGSGSLNTTEDILLTWGSGSQSVFDTEGNSDVEGTNSTPLEIKSVSYSTNYYDFSVIVSTEDETSTMFYFSDKSANVVLSVELGEDSVSNEDEDKCAALQLVMEYTENGYYDLKIYGDNTLVETGYDSVGGSVTKPSNSKDEEVEDFITLIDGKGSLSKPYLNNVSYSFPGSGTSLKVTQYSTEVEIDYEFSIYEEGQEDIPPIAVSITYNTRYSYGSEKIPNSFLSDPEKYYQYTVYFPTTCGGLLSGSVTVPDAEAEAMADECAALSLEAEEVIPGSRKASFKLYGNSSLVSQIYNNFESTTHIRGWNPEVVNETVTFTEGLGTLSKPYKSGMYAVGETVTATRYSTFVSISDTTKTRIISLQYSTKYGTFESSIPSGLTFNEDTELTVFVKTSCEEELSATVTLTPEGGGSSETRTITLNIKDYATDVAVSGASVIVDGSSRGTTDSEGNITITDISVGDHALKITASGYQSSDEDELANDTFTVV